MCSSGSFFGVTSSTEGCRTMASSPALGRPRCAFVRCAFVMAAPFTFVSSFGEVGASASDERVLLAVGGMAGKDIARCLRLLQCPCTI